MARELLFSITKKDFKIDWFSGTGAGGQHRNKHQNCCRMTHPDSGAKATGQESRSQKENLRNAFNRLVKGAKFKIWLNKKIYNMSQEAEIDRKEVERLVEIAMRPENLKIETYVPEE